jgi:AraC-like DNA-binding protein
MAANAAQPGYLVADIPVGPLPWSPWLRLAHLNRSTSGSTAALRRLRDWELILQLDGASWVWWERLGASSALPPGSMLLIPPGEAHAQGQVGEHLAVHFDFAAQPDLAAFTMIERLGTTRRRADSSTRLRWRLRSTSEVLHSIPAVTQLSAPDAWRERLMPLVRQWLLRQHSTPAARLQAAGIIATAVHDLANESEPEPDDPTRPTSGLSHLLSFLDLDSRRWTVAGLARRAGMGETAFRAAFRRLTDQSPRAWLEQRRFDRARHLLLSTSRSIARIAAACGYDDPFHFSRVCKRLTGCSPRQLRQQG